MKKTIIVAVLFLLLLSVLSHGSSLQESLKGVIAKKNAGGGDTTPPTLTSSTIPSAGTTISLLFSEPVTTSTGDDSSWTIVMTGGAVTMSYSSGSGAATIVYTLSRTVYSNETGTVAYLKGLNTGIKDLASNDLATIVTAAVTNNSTAGWSDNFNGGSGNLSARTGWGSTYYFDGTAQATGLLLGSNSVYQNGTYINSNIYNLATYTPTDADYTVSCTSVAGGTAAGDRILTPFVRASNGTGNALSGYGIRIVPNTGACGPRKWTNGSNSTITGADVTLTGMTYTNSNTYALKVSGSTTTTLEIFVNGVSKGTWTDTSSPYTAAGKGGISLYYITGDAASPTVDDFIITD